MATITATWFTDGSGAWVEDHADDNLVRLSVERWHEPGDREGTMSWVAAFTVIEPDGRPMQHRRRLERGPAEPALDEARRIELSELGVRAAAQGPTTQPKPVTFEFGTADELLIRQIELLHTGWGEAVGRVDEASRDDSKWVVWRLHQALTEAMLWTRLTDEVLNRAWRSAPRGKREAESAKTDAWLGRLLEAEPQQKDSNAALRAYTQRQTDGKPYDDWAVAAIGRGGSAMREDLDAFRWLAGKLLHLAPKPVTVLGQWRDGAEPRWKWRSAEEIQPKAQERREALAQRQSYEHHLEGRDVTGSLNLTTTFIEAEHMFFSLTRR